MHVTARMAMYTFHITSEIDPLERQLLAQLGARLKAAREARGMTADELARLVGVLRTGGHL